MLGTIADARARRREVLAGTAARFVEHTGRSRDRARARERFLPARAERKPCGAGSDADVRRQSPQHFYAVASQIMSRWLVATRRKATAVQIAFRGDAGTQAALWPHAFRCHVGVVFDDG